MGAMKLVSHNPANLRSSRVDPVAMLALESQIVTLMQGNPYIPKLLHAYAHSCNSRWHMCIFEQFSKGSLHSYVRTGNILSHSQIFAIGWRVAEALQALFEQGWFHLDVKPANIMMSDDPQRLVALIDFGLAKPTLWEGQGESRSRDGTFMFMGTRVWDKQKESVRDDLESLAFTLAWAMLGGKLPWSNMQKEDMQRHIQASSLPSQLGRQCASPYLESFLSFVRHSPVGALIMYSWAIARLKTGEGAQELRRSKRLKEA
jgi:serine/threonine protein kinase